MAYASPMSSGTPNNVEDTPVQEDDFVDRAKRRSHRKSRFGCNNCKTRRVKCDETRPACNNCKHRRIDCSFGATSSCHASPIITPKPVPSSNDVPPVADDLNVAEIELMYHWTMSTAKTVSAHDTGATYWQTHVTEIGLKHLYVVHLIFAITALHLAECRPARKEGYIRLANRHYEQAVPLVSSELSRLNAQNCDAVFLSVELISLIGWARGPQPGDFLAFGANRMSETLIMFRGIRTTIELLDYDAFTRSFTAQKNTRGRPLTHIVRLAYEQPLDNLRDYIEHASPSGQLDSNMSAMDLLQLCFSNRYNGVDSEYHDVFAWLFQVEDQFLDALQRHDAVPLVMYAHFAVLLKDIECHWYMKGWTTHVLEGIWHVLPDKDRVYLRWSIGTIGWIPP